MNTPNKSADVSTAQVVHTPTPWYIHPGSPSVIREPENDCIICDHCDINDARFIVRAVNCHADLVAACQQAFEHLESEGSATKAFTVAVLRAVLAKAEVQS